MIAQRLALILRDSDSCGKSNFILRNKITNQKQKSVNTIKTLSSVGDDPTTVDYQQTQSTLTHLTHKGTRP